MPAIQCSPQVEALRSAVTTRRSIRQFTEEPIPEDVLQDCLDMALLAPNSSNLQMWNFYRVTTPDKRAQLVKACMSQKAAKTAAELIVCTGHTRNWRRHAKEILVQWPGGNPPKVVQQYYGGLAQFMYGTVPLDMLGLGARAKKTVRDAIGLVRPMMRALRAYDFDSCPMEGFDEDRVRRICGYGRHEFTVMVIAAGRRHEKGIYHEQIRFDRTRFVHEI